VSNYPELVFQTQASAVSVSTFLYLVFLMSTVLSKIMYNWPV
jgi:hypothetical protein